MSEENKNMPNLTSDTLLNKVLLNGQPLYQEFLAEREEILRHKWIESEKKVKTSVLNGLSLLTGSVSIVKAGA